ncbi:MAG TPA: mechanosensitive ion channel domain-containing protein [Candidatus Krumholzibacteria bacterium]|nr:mechanosensitive ion channel domain-containing protein [Candidatus Krumholzibacteria bacterium]
MPDSTATAMPDFEDPASIQAWVEGLIPQLADFGIDLIVAIVIFVLGRMAVGLVAGAVRKAMARGKADPTLVGFVGNIVAAIGMAFVVIAAIDQLGVRTAGLVAVLGAAGLAVGFALQGSLSNFASGVMLLIFRPINVGDYVEAGGTSGSVKDIGIFTTTLHTPDNKKVIVPNAQVTSDTITNYSANDTRRVDLVAGIGYSDDIPKAKAVLERIAKEHELTLDDPAPMIELSNLGDSSVDFVVRPWVKTADYWRVYFDLTERIKMEFDKEGISIPFPQRDVHLFQESSN